MNLFLSVSRKKANISYCNNRTRRIRVRGRRRRRSISVCLLPSVVGAQDPLKPHTSLHSISGVLIWVYKEACRRKGQQLDSPLLGHKAPFHSHSCRVVGTTGLRTVNCDRAGRKHVAKETRASAPQKFKV